MPDSYPSFNEQFRRFDRPRNAALNDLALGLPIRPEYATNSVYLAARFNALRSQAQEDADHHRPQRSVFVHNSDRAVYLSAYQQAAQRAAKARPRA
jgi:hypothetical protein